METLKINTTLPDNSRIWIYQNPIKLHAETAHKIDSEAKTFVKNWTAHKNQLTADAFVLYNQFLILVADQQAVQASGCSIDSSVHFIKTLNEKYNLHLLDRQHIVYLNNRNELSTLSIKQFKTRCRTREITPDTLVFNNLITKLCELKTHWLVPANKSWIQSCFSAVVN